MKNYSNKISCACQGVKRKTKIFLLTGFLGAGKTTLLKALMKAFNGHKIGIIVNDFGKVNIDYHLVEEEGMTMAEVSNGSIFCACVKDKFVDSLIAMAGYDLEYLFIEASGLADPSNIQTILDGIEHKTEDAYLYQSAICVVDGENYQKMSKILPALKRQVKHSGIILINKADLLEDEILQVLTEMVSQENPQAKIIATSYCQFDYQLLLENTQQSHELDTLNTPESRPVTLTLESLNILDYSGFETFLQEIIPQTYRFKGFARTSQGDFEVSAVSERFELTKTDRSLEKTELVAISAVGIKLYNALLKAAKAHLNEEFKVI